MKRNITSVILGVLCILGGFLPMAEAGQYFVGIGHIGGLSYLLYPLSLAAIGLVVTAIYKPGVRYLRVWVGLVALLGITLACLSILNGISGLEFMANSMSSLNFLLAGAAGAGKANAAAGTGGLMTAVGYGGLLLLSIMPVWPAIQQEGV